MNRQRIISLLEEYARITRRNNGQQAEANSCIAKINRVTRRNLAFTWLSEYAMNRRVYFDSDSSKTQQLNAALKMRTVVEEIFILSTERHSSRYSRGFRRPGVRHTTRFMSSNTKACLRMLRINPSQKLKSILYETFQDVAYFSDFHVNDKEIERVRLQNLAKHISDIAKSINEGMRARIARGELVGEQDIENKVNCCIPNDELNAREAALNSGKIYIDTYETKPPPPMHIEFHIKTDADGNPVLVNNE